MKLIEPINSFQQRQVVAETERYIERACQLFEHQFESVDVVFDLKGRAAGMYKVFMDKDKRSKRLIRYNPYIFAKYYIENLSSTVPHEVAHYIVDILYGLRRVRPHGREWRDIMGKFGKEAERTSHFDLAGIPLRQTRRHDYRCLCRSHQLGSRRHAKVIQGRARYSCRDCGEVLVPAAIA